jgi:signal transduction histidine kinase
MIVSRIWINGSGMGLFIVEKIVKAHQGNFKVHSEGRGRGTTVIVELPKKQNE